MVRPMFATELSGAVIREGADEFTLRAQEEGVLRPFIGTSNVGDKKWVPHARRQGLACLLPGHFPRNRRSEWEAIYRYKDLHQAVESKKLNGNNKAKVLWAMKEAKDRGANYDDTNHKKIRREPSSGWIDGLFT